MTSGIINGRDLDFLLHEWLEVETLCVRDHFADHSRETFQAVIDLAARLAAAEFLPHYKTADRIEPTLDETGVHVVPEIGRALRAFAEAGFFAASFPAELDGLQLPHVVHTAAMAHFMAANVATAAYPMLTAGSARLLATFGSAAQIDAFARPQIAGRFFGTMCLSEPQAGSSLSDITTRAVPDGEDALGDRYRLTGNKMWISGGDQDISENIIHLVLAKVEGADGKLVPGTKGVSLFVVPKFLLDATGRPGERNDVTVAGLNHKMGYRGTTNCLLNFGEGTHRRPFGAPGAVGYRVGSVGQGLPIMFHMMNEARISVGLGAAMLGYRGYLLALAYARERLQGRPAAARGAGPMVPIIDHADVKRMLLAQKAYVEGALALILYAARLIDEEKTGETEAARRRAGDLLGLLTPIAKSWPSEWGLAANDIAIQIHGGYGYTRDFDVEQLYRDNRLNPIHEGTTGVQAMDLLGRKILKDRGAALALLGERIAATVGRALAAPVLAAEAQALAAAWAGIGATVRQLGEAGEEPGLLDNATPFLSAFGHGVLAWLWLDQALVAIRAVPIDADDTAFYRGKLGACRYFFAFELPKIDAWLGIVKSRTDIAAAMPDAAF
ncbi:MAG TPA: acyl-CoA dehydrogenase [Aliidongia sp.]|uniref:acyl-CoA dehydrogenase n=1 Tax=Aliidongia sp. TaxID=1914230 RepID=UPI002DDCDBF2|nr:acyl-CoA dehydrogenase [Aliidongia sp.]HEV2674434.1 acyl-CoA dehydrogenase [Aliidongia sp.]